MKMNFDKFYFLPNFNFLHKAMPVVNEVPKTENIMIIINNRGDSLLVGQTVLVILTN